MNIQGCGRIIDQFKEGNLESRGYSAAHNYGADKTRPDYHYYLDEWNKRENNRAIDRKIA
jgi:hypothetical protein